MDVTVKNLNEVQDYLEGLPAESFDVAKKEIGRTLLEVDSKVKTTTSLNSRTGQLFKSIKTQILGTNIKSLRGSIFTTSVYAPIHQYGGTIKAKNAYHGVPGGPYLNIPTDANKTPAGVTRLQAREVFSSGGYVAKFKSGKYGVMLNGQIMFFLTKQVEIPKRLNLVEESEDAVPTMLSRIAEKVGVS